MRHSPVALSPSAEWAPRSHERREGRAGGPTQSVRFAGEEPPPFPTVAEGGTQPVPGSASRLSDDRSAGLTRTPRPRRLWPQTFSSTSPPGAAALGGRCASAPGLATPRAPPRSRGWNRRLARPGPARPRPPALSAPAARPRADAWPDLGARPRARARARRSDWATGEKAAPRPGWSRRGAEPGVRPRAAAASSESRTRKEGTIEAHRGERSCPAAGDPVPRPSPAVRCEQGLGVPVGIGEPNRGGVSPAASPGSVGRCKRAGGTFTSTEAERGARVSACVRDTHTHQEKVSDLNVSATNSS
ncbi:translation initiation factor IF-2-like [Panthera pardus]|uniref:Translation initiation factor IF-2-like n=1 Tax=Panthera pardus TaxID=9691 RepID=A0A9W2URI5_PANPR|nr:translation initiation factor IF-2-like [Panthera pardus]